MMTDEYDVLFTQPKLIEFNYQTFMMHCLQPQTFKYNLAYLKI